MNIPAKYIRSVLINDLITLITLLKFCQWPILTPPTVHYIQACWVTAVHYLFRALRWHLKEYNVVVHLNLHFLDGFLPPPRCIHPAITGHDGVNIPANFRFPFTSKKTPNVQTNMKKLDFWISRHTLNVAPLTKPPGEVASIYLPQTPQRHPSGVNVLSLMGFGGYPVGKRTI